MSLGVSKTRLAALTRELSNNWQQAKGYWQDAKSAEFERDYIEPLVSNVEKALTVIDELDKVVARIRRDCE